jgi:hypothetical protein
MTFIECCNAIIKGKELEFLFHRKWLTWSESCSIPIGSKVVAWRIKKEKPLMIGDMEVPRPLTDVPKDQVFVYLFDSESGKVYSRIIPGIPNNAILFGTEKEAKQFGLALKTLFGRK